MIMGSSSCRSHHSGPKLENFLGQSYQDHNDPQQQHNESHHYMFQNCSAQHQAEALAAAPSLTTPGSTNNHNDKTIGLSMIKNWLRNNSAPVETVNNESSNGDLVMLSTGNGTLTNSAQTLSLSMSTGSMAGASSGGGGDSLSSDNKRQIEASNCENSVIVPRKSIDTFGQRTSIYRGVTRYHVTFICTIYFYFNNFWW